MRAMFLGAIGALLLGSLLFSGGTAKAQTPTPDPCGRGTVLIEGQCRPQCRYGSVLQFGVCVPVQPPITCAAPNVLVPQQQPGNFYPYNLSTVYGSYNFANAYNYGIGSLLSPGTILVNGQVVPNFYNQAWNGHGVSYNPAFNGYVTTVGYACVAPPAAPAPTPVVVKEIVKEYVPVPVQAAPAPAPVPQRQVFITPPKTGTGGLISE